MNEPLPPDPSEQLVQLIAQAQRRLFAFVLAMVRRSADAEDILQEINVVLWRKRESYRAGTDFLAWAFEIARYQVLSHRTRQVRGGDPFDVALLVEIAEAASFESCQFDQLGVALRQCLQKLPARQRELILKRYQPDVAVSSLAAEVGRSANAISELLRRIRETLRQCIVRPVPFAIGSGNFNGHRDPVVMRSSGLRLLRVSPDGQSVAAVSTRSRDDHFQNRFDLVAGRRFLAIFIVGI